MDSTTPVQKTVLIVDDSELDRDIIKHWLARDPEFEYTIFESGCSEEGLKFCESTFIDCILLDYELPDLNGIEFLSELEERFGKLVWPVVMLTGFGTEEIAVEAMKRGAHDYIVKGNISSDNLHRAIRNALEKRESENQAVRELIDLRQKVSRLSRETHSLKHVVDEKDEEIQKLSDRLIDTLQSRTMEIA